MLGDILYKIENNLEDIHTFFLRLITLTMALETLSGSWASHGAWACLDDAKNCVLTATGSIMTMGIVSVTCSALKYVTNAPLVWENLAYPAKGHNAIIEPMTTNVPLNPWFFK